MKLGEVQPFFFLRGKMIACLCLGRKETKEEIDNFGER